MSSHGICEPEQLCNNHHMSYSFDLALYTCFSKFDEMISFSSSLNANGAKCPFTLQVRGLKVVGSPTLYVYQRLHTAWIRHVKHLDCT